MLVQPDKFQHQAAATDKHSYMVFGDEPQQKMMALDAVRHAVYAKGFTERTRLCVETGFDWRDLEDAYRALSLFSPQQFIEIELTSNKLSAEGAKGLITLAGQISPDLIVLIHGPALNKDAQKAKWFAALDKVSLTCLVYPLDERQLTQWIRQQMASRGLGQDAASAAAIAQCCEGNMLAAAQEIEKLCLQFDGQTPSTEDIIAAVTQQSRYTLFQFIDCLLQGETKRAMRILGSLESEGVEPNYILWALVREWQILWEAKTLERQQRPINWLSFGVWRQRQAFYLAALSRLQPSQLISIQTQLVTADQAFKQSTMCRPFVVIAHLSMMFLGYPLNHLAAVHV